MCFHFFDSVVPDDELPVDAEEIFCVQHLLRLVQVKVNRIAFALIGANKIGFILGIKISDLANRK